MLSFARALVMNAAAGTRPGRVLFRRRVARAGYDDQKNSDEYVRGVFDWHWPACGRPTSGAVLEIGPGGNVAVARLFAEQGCSPVICIDTMPYVDDADAGGVEYRAPEAIEDTPLPDESFDVIYSHAALEHVSDPARSAASIARLLRPGGVTSHVVDLRDHRDFEHPHAFLGYPEWLWRRSGNHRGWPNRWRASDWREGFEAAGLETEVTSTMDAPLDPGQKLARRFAAKDRADLEVVGILVVARKPR